jgi:hypothetical protein
MAKPLSPAARDLLAARARRIAPIRKRIVVAAVAAFVLAWCVIAYAGPMGASTATTTAAAGSTSSSSSGDDGARASGTWDSGPSASTVQRPSVTTSQS